MGDMRGVCLDTDTGLRLLAGGTATPTPPLLFTVCSRFVPLAHVEENGA